MGFFNCSLRPTIRCPFRPPFCPVRPPFSSTFFHFPPSLPSAPVSTLPVLAPTSQLSFLFHIFHSPLPYYACSLCYSHTYLPFVTDITISLIFSPLSTLKNSVAFRDFYSFIHLFIHLLLPWPISLPLSQYLAYFTWFLLIG
jgi:hypothetical protein